MFADWGFAAHLADLLAGCGWLEPEGGSQAGVREVSWEIDGREVQVLVKLRDVPDISLPFVQYLVLQYAQSLMDKSGLWTVASTYLSR